MQLEPHASGEQPPSTLVPRQVDELWHVDGSNPGAPRIVSRAPVPAGALELAVHAGGYTALGALVAANGAALPQAGCGSGTLAVDLPAPLPQVEGLWLQSFGPQGSSSRRELGAGHWHLSSDQSHAIRIGLPAHTAPTGSFEV